MFELYSTKLDCCPSIFCYPRQAGTRGIGGINTLPFHPFNLTACPHKPPLPPPLKTAMSSRDTYRPFVNSQRSVIKKATGIVTEKTFNTKC